MAANALKIPEGGVLLKGGPGEDSGPLPQQVFTISLSDTVIEDMIRCVQGGEDLQLALGPKPTLRYDSKSHRIAPPMDDHPYDLYLTQPYNTLREATAIPAMSIFDKPRKATKPMASKGVSSSAKPKAQQSHSSSNSGIDSDIEALQNGIAAHEAAKERSVLLSRPLDPKRHSKKSNQLSWGNANTNRSLSTSPAIKPASPSTNPALSSLERAKQQRVPLIHELAVGEQTTDYLQKKWNSKPEDFRNALEKVADAGSDGKKWALRKQFWRELDVWKYDYDHEEDRKQAIKNAIRQYDKQRLSASEPEWERLNSPEDRGKGICLSSLQSRINNKSTAPTIKVQRADESSTSKDDGEDDAKPLKSEPMSRSGSNPLSKTKKPTASEAQAKRLLSNKSKPAAPAPQKKSPTKPKAAKETNGGKQPLSQEFIENSDSSEDEPIAKSEAPRKAAPKASDSKPTAKPAAKPAERPVSKLADKTTTSATATKPKATAPPVQRPSTTATKTAPKRPLDDDDSSSSSGTPLSKRIKPKQPLPARPQAVKKRPLDSSRHVSSSGMAARDREAMANNRHKNTSPTKSSPLAASPPTNASDASDDPPPPRAVMAGKKRKADVGDSSGNRTLPPPAAKRAAHDESVPADVLSQAARFKEKYTEYEALHYEVSALANPPSSKLADLRVMRDKLARLKAQIYKKCNNV